MSSSSNNPAHVFMLEVSSDRKSVVTEDSRHSPGISGPGISAIQSYHEEFTFRFNRRTSRIHGLIFIKLLEQTVITNPATKPDIIGGYNCVLKPDAD
jgi:hypothetical protein